MSLIPLIATPADGAYHAETVFETGAHIAVPPEIAALLDSGGRVTSITVDGPGAAGLTADGRIAYRPGFDFVGDERITLVAADDRGARTVTVEARVEKDVAAKGWSDGEHYLLAQDENGWSVTEPGANHRKVFVSPDGDPSADGLTPETAITPGALQGLLNTLKPVPSSSSSVPAPSSWHVLFERGHYYGDFAPPVQDGEDALHPFVVGAYGEGDRPLFTANLTMHGTGEAAIQHYVARDLAFGYPDASAAPSGGGKVSGIDTVGAGHANILFENLLIEAVNGDPVVTAKANHVTLYRVATLDAHHVDPVRGDDWSDPIRDRVSGFYAARVDGLLVLETLADHNGWQSDYDPTGAYADAQPPSAYSHNFYIDFSVENLTFAGNVSASGASFGAQLRPGGAAYGNVFYNNNIAINMLGGGLAEDGLAEDGFAGYMGLLLDTVATESDTKLAQLMGGRGWGVNLAGPGAAVDVIVAQDGDAPAVTTSGATRAFYQSPNDAMDYTTDGVTVFNWGANPERTLSGADRDRMTATTLDSLAASAGLSDAEALIDALRARDADTWGAAPDADDIVAFFRKGFGYDPLDTASGRLVTFSADARGEGFRWDNRLNWSDDRAPTSGDRVSLDGHDITYGLQTLTLAGLDLGEGGALRVTQAKVETTALTAGALGGRVLTSGAGQFVFDGYADPDRLTLIADGGRIANTGRVTGGADVTARDGQLLLADGEGLFSLDAGDILRVIGDAARVGFDGAAGEAILRLEGGALRFEASASGISPIVEFASGRHGVATPGVRSVLDLRSGVIEVDLTDYDPANGASLLLVDADVLLGDLSALQTRIVGAPAGYDARIGVNVAAAALGVTLTGGAEPAPPPISPAPPSGPSPAPAPAPEEGGVIWNWRGSSPPAYEAADGPPVLRVDWSVAEAPKLAVLQRDGGAWGDARSWRDARAAATGDWVQTEGRTAVIADGSAYGVTALNLGDGGAVEISDGLLEARRVVGADARIALVDDGQFLFNGYGGADALALDVAGGRAINAGTVSGRLTTTVSDGQLLLTEGEASFRLADGAALTVSGDAAAVGFNGAAGKAALDLTGGVLRFEADATGVSTIREFASGRNGDVTGVWSVFNMQAGVIEVDLGAYDPRNGLDLTLIDVDELIGNVGGLDLRITGAPTGYYARFGINGEDDTLGVRLFAGAAPPPSSEPAPDAPFEPLAVNWQAAAKPALATLGRDGDWSDPAAWAGRTPVTGDWVRVSGHEARFEGGVFGATALNLGDGGVLQIEDGLLEARKLSGAGRVTLVDDGQFLFGGYAATDGLSLEVSGGRAINTGRVHGAVDAVVSAGEMLLGDGHAEYRVLAGSSLSIVGDDARIGFDGAGGVEASLLLDRGALRFKADASGVSAITEFASGRHGAAPNVESRVILNGGLIEVDLSDYDASDGASLTLIDVDRIEREFFSFVDQDFRVVGLDRGFSAGFVMDEEAGLLRLDVTETLIFG